MAQVAHTSGSGGHGDHAEHASHPGARTYVFIFVVLFIVTLLEVFVAQEPLSGMVTGMGVPLAIPLLVLAVAKFFMIAAFYMHLKQDSRIFTALFLVGLTLAIGMWLSFMGLFTAHYREPFDEEAWRAEMAQSGGAGGAAGTTGTGTTGGSGGGH